MSFCSKLKEELINPTFIGTLIKEVTRAVAVTGASIVTGFVIKRVLTKIFTGGA